MVLHVSLLSLSLHQSYQRIKLTNPSFVVTFTADYTDLYISTKEGLGAFIGNRSVVIHKAGGARLTCANITLVSNVPTGPAVTQTPAPDSNSASSFGISSVLALGGMLAAVAAFAL